MPGFPARLRFGRGDEPRSTACRGPRPHRRRSGKPGTSLPDRDVAFTFRLLRRSCYRTLGQLASGGRDDRYVASPSIGCSAAVGAASFGGSRGDRRVRHLRERAGAAAGAVARRRHASSRSTRRTTGSRSSTSPAAGLTHAGSVPVGLEPVAVAARTNAEVWVVNHLSDSVSIVDVGDADAAARRAHAARRRRAARHRLRRAGRQPRLHHHRAPRPEHARIDPRAARRPGIGRADVWVFDATNLGATLGGTPLTIVTLFGDTPRALAVTPDGSTVYAAVFHSGNQTTAVSEGAVCNGGSARLVQRLGATMPGGCRHRTRTSQSIAGPETGLIVKFDRRRPAGTTSSAATGTTPCVHAARPGRVRDRRRRQPAASRTERLHAASARSSSTWRSTR